MAESSTKSAGGATGAGTTETAAVAPGLVPGDAGLPSDATKAQRKEAASHIADYCDQVEGDLGTLEDGIKQIRSAAKALKADPQSGLIDELRNIISDVFHSVPFLRGATGPRAHIEHRTLPAPDPNDPNVVSATGAEPIL